MVIDKSVMVKCKNCGYVFKVKLWIYKKTSNNEIYCPKCNKRGVEDVARKNSIKKMKECGKK